MKTALITLCILWSMGSMAQDSLNKTVTCPAKQLPVIIMPRIMKEKEIMKILSEKNDPEINNRIIKIKTSKHLQYVGFFAIPAGIIGTTCLLSDNSVRLIPTRHEIRYMQLGYGFMALVPVCLSASIYFKCNRNYNYKKAIQRYNSLYN